MAKNDNNMIWFTSDLHFYHEKILEFNPSRKTIFGKTIQESNEAMIAAWNKRIGKRDTIYILGDLTFGSVDEKRKLLQRLNGNKILILGNHDKVSEDQSKFFNHVTQIKNMKFKKSVHPFLLEDLEVVMCHFPMLSWEHREKGTVMLHGHCHGKLDNFNKESKTLRVDVGIDAELANYDFISLEKLNNHIMRITNKLTPKEYLKQYEE